MMENVQVNIKDWKTILGTQKRENIIGVKTRVGIYFPLIKNSLILESIKQKISITQNAMDLFVDAFGDSG